MCIAIFVVDTANCWPVRFVWIDGCLFSRIFLVPFRRHQHIHGMRRISQRRFRHAQLVVFNALNFFSNLNHSVTETVQLGQRLRLCRLHHQCVRHWPRHGRRMKCVIHQAFGNVFGANLIHVLFRILWILLLKLATINDKFVRAQPLSAIHNRIVVFQALRHIVCGQYTHRGGTLQSVIAHHANIHPRNDENGGRRPWRRRYRSNTALLKIRGHTTHHWMFGQERLQFAIHANGP
mmetsp:Transcript_18491/g.29339  ORF Transcript_18491/g.29339 Transcript_18491/m.29339 type:complete len:235 (-) Transcript_18491:1072-1776(-)